MCCFQGNKLADLHVTVTLDSPTILQCAVLIECQWDSEYTFYHEVY